jgi:hypothetical protein
MFIVPFSYGESLILESLKQDHCQKTNRGALQEAAFKVASKK